MEHLVLLCSAFLLCSLLYCTHTKAWPQNSVQTMNFLCRNLPNSYSKCKLADASVADQQMLLKIIKKIWWNGVLSCEQCCILFHYHKIYSFRKNKRKNSKYWVLSMEWHKINVCLQVCDVQHFNSIQSCSVTRLKYIYQKEKKEKQVNVCVCTVTYFGSTDHCSCIGLWIVTTSSSARLVTSDQLQKHKDLQINTRHTV